MSEEEKTAKVIGLMKQTEAAPTSLKPLPLLGNKVVIYGNVNHFAGGKTSVKVVVAPPAIPLISKAQKAALVERRDQWVDLHNTLKARQITRNDARKALNAKAKVTAHRLIPATRYADLMRWLEARIEALRTTEQHLTESTPDDANPDTDLTPPHKQRPPPFLRQLNGPNAVQFVPNTTLTPGVQTQKPRILCQPSKYAEVKPDQLQAPSHKAPPHPASSRRPFFPVPNTPLPHIPFA